MSYSLPVSYSPLLCHTVQSKSGGPEGPSRWPKATSPPQELEVGGRRPPYLLVNIYHKVIGDMLVYGQVAGDKRKHNQVTGDMLVSR